MLLSVLFESCSGIIQESFINHSLIIHSGIIQESFIIHSSIIMNQAQNPSFSSLWPRGVSMVSPIPRLSLHFLSYPLFIYVFRTDNDDRHVHVHVCACVCMCMCMCMVICSCVSGPTTIIDTCMRMCVHVLKHCYSPPHHTCQYGLPGFASMVSQALPPSTCLQRLPCGTTL